MTGALAQAEGCRSTAGPHTHPSQARTQRKRMHSLQTFWNVQRACDACPILVILAMKHLPDRSTGRRTPSLWSASTRSVVGWVGLVICRGGGSWLYESCAQRARRVCICRVTHGVALVWCQLAVPAAADCPPNPFLPTSAQCFPVECFPVGFLLLPTTHRTACCPPCRSGWAMLTAT